MISIKQLFALASCLLVAVTIQLVASQQVTTNAKLLVDKEILNKYIVEGRDVLVKYHLINIGGSVARDVKVIDDTFPSDRFEIINGYTSFIISQVVPGANVTHAAVVRPRANSWGPHRFGPARVEYKNNDAGQLQLATTSELGEAYIVAARTFDRKFSSQFVDWFIFAILCVPSLAGPYYLWYKSDSKLSNSAQRQANKKLI